ncbi:MAG: hypothetical protein A2X94_12360 [Bdellovibrionales bacterium GWB1_55_8]|nr:MAG: hypothetical protein A2X94_12360 [Bdellovibrionales bacterium GWB1_55_8]
MGFLCTGLLVSPLWGGGAALAQEREQTDTVTTAEASELTRGFLKDETVAVKPLVGAIAFDDVDGNTARMAYGLEIDWNAAPLFGEMMEKDMFFGPTVGFIYSHLGAPTSDFIGRNPDNEALGQAGSNMAVIPTNLKVGYNVAEAVRLSAHGGGNIIYRSVANSINLGDDSTGSDSLWKYYPNAGADIEFGLGQNAALSLRPDWTFAPNDDLFMGTVALAIGLG